MNDALPSFDSEAAAASRQFDPNAAILPAAVEDLDAGKLTLEQTASAHQRGGGAAPGWMAAGHRHPLFPL